MSRGGNEKRIMVLGGDKSKPRTMIFMEDEFRLQRAITDKVILGRLPRKQRGARTNHCKQSNNIKTEGDN